MTLPVKQKMWVERRRKWGRGKSRKIATSLIRSLGNGNGVCMLLATWSTVPTGCSGLTVPNENINPGSLVSCLHQ